VAIAVSPQTPYVTFISHATTGAAKSDATIDMSADARDASGRHAVTIVGSQPIGAPVLYAYRVPEPKSFAEAAFSTALNGAGVHVEGANSTASNAASPASYTPTDLVAKHVSPPLSEDAYITLKVSDNLHAALMPYEWAVYRAHATSDYLKKGFALEVNLLQRADLDLSEAAQSDGYGGAYFTPDFMVHYLAWARAQSWYPLLFRGLPIMGVDGTLVNIARSSPARGKVFAKTGTDGSENYLNEGGIIEKGLAGYITTRGGHHVAFAFYLSAMPGPHDEDTGAIAGQILGAMAAATYERL
jgi:serine-type D-Ala-D-Ala carboxypeptidase/endopeptidase (penicillin-binding protein 4)